MTAGCTASCRRQAHTCAELASRGSKYCCMLVSPAEVCGKNSMQERRYYVWHL